MLRTPVVSHHCFDGKLSAKHDSGSGSAVLCWPVVCHGVSVVHFAESRYLLSTAVRYLFSTAVRYLLSTAVDIYCLPLLDIFFLHFAVSVLHPTSRIESEGWF